MFKKVLPSQIQPFMLVETVLEGAEVVGGIGVFSFKTVVETTDPHNKIK